MKWNRQAPGASSSNIPMHWHGRQTLARARARIRIRTRTRRELRIKTNRMEHMSNLSTWAIQLFNDYKKWVCTKWKRFTTETKWIQASYIRRIREYMKTDRLERTSYAKIESNVMTTRTMATYILQSTRGRYSHPVDGGTVGSKNYYINCCFSSRIADMSCSLHQARYSTVWKSKTRTKVGDDAWRPVYNHIAVLCLVTAV